ncbi:MAG TPA: hypothetical protein VEN79_09950, partial [Terriglobia bacterium]|nr:hypothetical protein [Terriglobia bacterium]
MKEAYPYLLAFTLVAATVVGFVRLHISSQYTLLILLLGGLLILLRGYFMRREQKRAEQELHRVNRALRTMSDCNKALVRGAQEPV